MSNLRFAKNNKKFEARSRNGGVLYDNQRRI